MKTVRLVFLIGTTVFLASARTTHSSAQVSTSLDTATSIGQFGKVETDGTIKPFSYGTTTLKTEANQSGKIAGHVVLALGIIFMVVFVAKYICCAKKYEDDVSDMSENENRNSTASRRDVANQETVNGVPDYSATVFTVTMEEPPSYESIFLK